MVFHLIVKNILSKDSLKSYLLKHFINTPDHKKEYITMNPNNWFDMENFARERQREIENELATRRLLKEAGLNLPKNARSKRIWLRFVPVFVLLTLLLLYFFH
jgi:hypothetical protein